ncbi:hypothetical protein JZ751_004700 [Albula glossodonta]|uniref:Uncharacterized protein n=1 Tax=Albula glossodonta TaxID=121402 RepID=A0A8T2MNS3_9TELE|nr:hypothetical protein JZ751_006504 [Albula glossodonta]KAG9329456.1 hypothetical protein JZ751_004700 [Albula glossodonta]
MFGVLWSRGKCDSGKGNRDSVYRGNLFDFAEKLSGLMIPLREFAMKRGERFRRRDGADDE